MPRVTANGIELEYETFGSETDPPLLLIMGLGAQMLLWEEGFCRQLTDRGLRVIRFDNRDIGLSTRPDSLGVPDLRLIAEQVRQGEPPELPYTLHDMARDCVGLLDALGIDSAHICGSSMGGMIAQILAARYPERVRSLVSIMSTTGNPNLPTADKGLMAKAFGRRPSGREEGIEHTVEVWRAISGQGFPFDEERIRQRTIRQLERGYFPDGVARQYAAAAFSGDRRTELAGIEAPTLVIHGKDDPLVLPEAGRDTARSIPHAELWEVEGMGHDLPEPLWPELARAIADHAGQVPGT